VKPETVIKLRKFVLRDYQLPIFDAIENKGYKRVLAILPRRAGKDYAAWYLLIRQALKKVGVYWYIGPTYSQMRKIVWDSIDNDGLSFLSALPAELIDRKNDQLMKIHLINGSIIQLVGSENYDSLVGTNAIGCVFTEYALQDPRAYSYLRPVLTANDGWAVFLSTPRGRNHLYELWQIAQNSPTWFAYKMSILETNHIPLHAIEAERENGEMSDDLIQQEYYCSFDMGVEGSFYSKYVDKMRLRGQITKVPHEPGFKVHTAWDLGVNDPTVIIFYQVVGQIVRIVDCYENRGTGMGLAHYAKVLAQYAQDKGYNYGKHFAPHDIAVRSLSTGISRWETARNLGIRFEARHEREQIHSAVPNLSVDDGIEAVRATLVKVWIDEDNCQPLIKALENYRQEYDHKHRVYKSNPLHDWSSHWADAMRYLCISLSKTKDGLTPEELDKRYHDAVMGSNANMPSIFRDDLPPY